MHATSRNLFYILGCAVLFTATTAVLINNNITGAVFNADRFYWNVFFVNIGFMGDAVFAFGLVFFLRFFLRQKKKAGELFQLLAVVLVGIQGMKIITGDEGIKLYFEASNAAVTSSQNFISSHSAIAFTLAAFFVQRCKHPITVFFILMLAVTVAYAGVFLRGEPGLAILYGLIPATVGMIFQNRANFLEKVRKFLATRKSVSMGAESLSGF